MTGSAHFRTGGFPGLAGLDMATHALAMIGPLTVDGGRVVMAGPAAHIRGFFHQIILIQDIDAVFKFVMAVQALVKTHVQVMRKGHR